MHVDCRFHFMLVKIGDDLSEVLCGGFSFLSDQMYFGVGRLLNEVRSVGGYLLRFG